MLEIRHTARNVAHRRPQRFRHEQHLGAAVREDVGILLGRQQRIQRHRHHAGANGAEEDDRKIDRIEHDHRDALFAAYAETAQQVGETPGLGLQRAVGQIGNGVGKGELAAPALVDIAVEQPGDGVIRPGQTAHVPPRRTARAKSLLITAPLLPNFEL